LASLLSTRPIEALLLERGVDVEHSTVNRWVITYRPQLEEAFHRRRHPGGVSWRMDEPSITITGQWYSRSRAVDTTGQTVGYLLTEHRDEHAAQPFLTRAIRRHGVPEKSTIEGSVANEAAITSDKTAHGTASALRHITSLNTLVAQDHRAGQRVTRPMRGCTSFDAAHGTLAGIERLHRLKKTPWVVEAGEEGRTAAEPCYTLAASLPPREEQLPLHDLLSTMCATTGV
jgi:putative transposase